MSVVFVLVFIAAIIGIFKPYISGAKRSHFAVAAVVSFILVGVFAPTPAADQAQTAEAPDSDNSQADKVAAKSSGEPATKWEYSETKDEMRGTTTKFASVESENVVNLDFPYGEVRGQIWIRRRPEDGLNVAFEVQKGQVLCHSFSDNHVSIKFDDGPIQKFRCSSSSDGSSETAFILDEQRALSALKRARRTIVEAEFYQQGRQQFVFNTVGLDWK